MVGSGGEEGLECSEAMPSGVSRIMNDCSKFKVFFRRPSSASSFPFSLPKMPWCEGTWYRSKSALCLSMSVRES